VTTSDAPDVLIVDDDPDMVETIAMVLEADGYSCRTATNGREALVAAEFKRPAIVLLDMVMPVMNGWDCARALRARYGHDIRVVAVTAAEHAVARGRQAGADDVLSKPFDIHALRAIVAGCFKRQSA
jgi:DNA-binding response OmpR family regulator